MGRKKKTEKKSFLYVNVVALILIFLGILIEIAFFQPQDTSLKSFLVNNFGFSAIFLGLVLSLLGVYISPVIKVKKISQKVILGFFVLFVSFLLFEGVLSGHSAVSVLLRDFFGGIVGFYGSIILGIMFFMLSMYLIFSTKFINLLRYIFSFRGGVFKIPAFFSFNKWSKSRNVNANGDPKDTLRQEEELDFNFESIKELQADLVELSPSSNSKNYEEVDTFTEPFELVKSKNVGFKIDDTSAEFSLKKNDKDFSDSADTLGNQATLYKNKIWEYPPLSILTDAPKDSIDLSDIEERKRIIISTLNSFGIKATIAGYNRGPSVTQYEIKVDEGIKTSKIVGLQNDLALALASKSGHVRIEAPIPGKSHVGIEVPNNVQQLVLFKPFLQSPQYKIAKEKSKLSLVIGKDVGGNYIYSPLNKMPHLLVAGATGSGKSVMIHSIIFSILFANSPDECKFIMIDPKRVEMVHYNDIPHLLTPVIHESSQAVSALRWVTGEMDRRLKVIAKSPGIRNIESYNEKAGFQSMPYLVVIIDELSDLMMTSGNEIEKYIIRIGQMARATGIHLVLATQRPSTNIITGSIKANVPGRIAFSVASNVDSRVILDNPGAEKLLGKGDMLFVSFENPKPIRVQGAFIKDEEIQKLVTFLKNSDVRPDYNLDIVKQENSSGSDYELRSSGEGDSKDDLFAEAVRVVVAYKRGSSSLLQRKLKIGYSRAARLIDDLQDAGVLGEMDSSNKSREVLINSPEDVLGSK